MMKTLQKSFAIAGVIFWASTASVFAQDNTQTLAGIRAELVDLNNLIQGLRAEMVADGTATSSVGTQGPALLRIDAIENELRSLTGQVEQLEFRINQVVKDGTNRVGDLEFRLVELEGGDVTQLGQTPLLGGETSTQVAAAPATPVAPVINEPAGGAELAVAERADFDAGYAEYQAGNYAVAAEKFLTFAQNFPGGPLTGHAMYWRGESLAAIEDWKNAARSFLDSFSGAPEGEVASKSLLRLGVSLGKLDKREQACKTLTEVASRYPDTPEVAEAAQEKSVLGCG